MEQIKKLFEKSNVHAAKLWGANLKNGDEWKLSFNYSQSDSGVGLTGISIIKVTEIEGSIVG